jgi:hypothetical protein
MAILKGHGMVLRAISSCGKLCYELLSAVGGCYEEERSYGDLDSVMLQVVLSVAASGGWGRGTKEGQ